MDDTSPTDGRELMLRFQSGDESAFEALVLRYQGLVRHFLLRYLRDRDRAEDLVQEVFLRVFRSRGRYEATAGFSSWLLTITTRLALNEIRGLRRRRRVFSESGADDSADEGGTAWERAPDHREDEPTAGAEAKELEKLIDRLIANLPEQQRAAILLCRLHDLSYAEIAVALETTIGAVKSLVLRARENLRRGLEPYLEGERLGFSLDTDDSGAAEGSADAVPVRTVPVRTVPVRTVPIRNGPIPDVELRERPTISDGNGSSETTEFETRDRAANGRGAQLRRREDAP
jgi:RNA polymerase sigma-70 factor (ECF subfamily)